MNAANTQTERTRMAWRRMVLAMLVAGLLGAIHLVTAGFTELAGLVGLISVVGCLPAWMRRSALRSDAPPPPARLEMLTVTVASCLLAAVVLAVR